MQWLSLLHRGDWLIAILGTVLCAVSFPLAWQGGNAEKAVVRRGGEVFAELDLSRNRRIEVPGPLGTTTIAVEITSRARNLPVPQLRGLAWPQLLARGLVSAILG